MKNHCVPVRFSVLTGFELKKCLKMFIFNDFCLWVLKVFRLLGFIGYGFSNLYIFRVRVLRVWRNTLGSGQVFGFGETRSITNNYKLSNVI